MRHIVPAILLLASLPLTPFAAAGAPCEAVTEATPDLGGWYVLYEHQTVQVWHEDNGAPGLQRAGCVNADGQAVGPDFRNVDAGVPDLPCRIQGGMIVCPW